MRQRRPRADPETAPERVAELLREGGKRFLDTNHSVKGGRWGASERPFYWREGDETKRKDPRFQKRGRCGGHAVIFEVDDDDDDDEDDDVDKEDAKQATEAMVRAASSTLGSAADADTIMDIAAAERTDKPAEMQLHTEDSEKESKEHESLVFSDESTPNAVRSPSAVDYASRVSTEMEDDRKKWRAELNAIAKKHLGNIDELIGGTPDSGTVDFWKKKSVFSKD